MALNSIALITKYSSEAWDKVYKKESISSIFDQKSGLVKFVGAKKVMIAQIKLGGLSDYTRNNLETGAESGDLIGYQKGAASLVWKDYEMRYDRATTIPVEKFDDEETDGLALGATVAELSRTVVVPEVDAITFSEIYKQAAMSPLGGNIKNGATTTPLAELNEGFTYLDNAEVPAEDQIILISPNYLNLLRNTTELTKFMIQGDYLKDVSFKMTSYEGRKLVVVPPQRFNTEVALEKNGYRVTGTPIDFMIVPKSAVTHVVKFEKVKVLSGDLALAATNIDGYAVYARVYHDVFVLENKRIGIYAHTGAISATGLATGQAILTAELNASKKVTKLAFYPNSVYAIYKQTAAANDARVVVGSQLPSENVTAVKVGDTISANATIFAVDSYGKVLAKTSVTTN